MPRVRQTTWGQILVGVSEEQAEFGKQVMDEALCTITTLKTLRVRVLHARGENTRRNNKHREENDPVARMHYRRATRKGFWVEDIKVVPSSLNDPWRKDEMYRTELINEGHSLDDIKKRDEIGLTVGPDQPLHDLSR